MKDLPTNFPSLGGRLKGVRESRSEVTFPPLDWHGPWTTQRWLQQKQTMEAESVFLDKGPSWHPAGRMLPGVPALQPIKKIKILQEFVEP
jgi:hypothetical protein